MTQPIPNVVKFDNHSGLWAAATATAGAATCNATSGTITTESLVTAAGSTYTLTVACSYAVTNPASVAMASVNFGTATTGTPCITTVAPTDGQLVIKVKNVDSTNAFNGTLVVSFNIET